MHTENMYSRALHQNVFIQQRASTKANFPLASTIAMTTPAAQRQQWCHQIMGIQQAQLGWIKLGNLRPII